MSDTYAIAGPLGREPEVLSSTMAEARLNPASPVFQCTGVVDSHGRLVLSCSGPGEWSLVLVDPVSLEVLAHKLMPTPADLSTAIATAYAYLDNRDRLVLPVADLENHTNNIQVMQTVESSGEFSFEFEVVSEYDISDYIPEGDNINGLLPDWQGRIWFVVRESGVVGVLDPMTGSVQTLELDGSITNSFAMDGDAAYIVTTERMYRIEAGPDGAPQVVWEAGYDPNGHRRSRPGTRCR